VRQEPAAEASLELVLATGLAVRGANSLSEIQHAFTPAEAETGFATSNTRSRQHTFCLLVLLNSFQPLHYFPTLDQVPKSKVTLFYR
jgi:hypothetical protein